MKKLQKGFTLIELMIVVAIIAILAAIAISQYQDYVIRSQVSEGSALADGVKTAMAEFQQNKGHFPANNTSAGLALSTSILGSYVSDVNVGTTVGRVVVTYGRNRRDFEEEKVAADALRAGRDIPLHVRNTPLLRRVDSFEGSLVSAGKSTAASPRTDSTKE